VTPFPESTPAVSTLWESFGKWRDAQTRLQLVEHYLPLAKIIAARMYGARIDQSIAFDDYLQYARVGLMESVDRFDASRGSSFESYATHRIRGAILNGFGNESEAAAQRHFWRTRMTDRMQSLVPSAGKDAQRASLGDLAEITVGIALGVMLDEDDVVAADESPQANPYAAAELAQLTHAVKALVEKLPEREREIVRGHYFEHLEFQAIAQRYAISKGRVSQLHQRALARLHELLEEHPRLDRRF
jgi:RNA polymerase sigma factor for flagellar operon FliA